jgi:nucleotide-binding universal stress UspA family protein
MKILLAADGSKFTKKALAFLVTHEGLLQEKGELRVLNVQPAFSPQVRNLAGARALAAYQKEEAEKVFAPIRRFLDRHAGVRYTCEWVAGEPAAEIAKAASQGKAHLVVMGTHGHGAVGRAFLGSVAQRVSAKHEGPLLLVR